jgi:hypothetical protein
VGTPCCAALALARAARARGSVSDCSPHGRRFGSTADARARAQVGNALPNEWLFQAALSVQLLGTDGTGCAYSGAGVSTWYGDGGSATAPQLGLFFPTTATLVPNPAGAGVGYDQSNLVAAAACAATSNCTATPWVSVPTGAQAWASSGTNPAPYFTLPASAWPACTGSAMSFNGVSYAASLYPTAAATSAAAATPAARGLLLAASAAAAAPLAAAL